MTYVVFSHRNLFLALRMGSRHHLNAADGQRRQAGIAASCSLLAFREFAYLKFSRLEKLGKCSPTTVQSNRIAIYNQ